MDTQEIKVLIVDDSQLVCDVLADLIATDPMLRVVGFAANGREAVDKTLQLKPDIISMDIKMPVMDGLEATRQIMSLNPTPIVILSSLVEAGGEELIFKALNCGALEVVAKPMLKKEGTPEQEASVKDYLSKLKFLAHVRVIRHPLAHLERGAPPPQAFPARKDVHKNIVGIVASTGGPKALFAIFKELPPDFPCGVLVVQHISVNFEEPLAVWLDSECKLVVKIAEDGEQIKAGTAYIAPSAKQMRAAPGNRIKLTDDPPYLGHRPSGNVLLESIAEVYKDKALGIVLTGMGSDGAKGMKAIKDNGGYTIVEDEATSVVFGMPKAALEACEVDRILPLDKIAPYILQEV